MRLLRFIIFLFIIGFQWSCTGWRVVSRFVPDTDDYKVFPSDTLRAESPRADDWVRSADNRLPPMEQWIPKRYLERYEKRSGSLNDFLEATGTTSLIVVRNDTVLYESYPNGGAPDQVRIVFSVGKTLVSTMVAIAVAEGKMSLDQSIADFIPEFCDDPRRRRITIRHLLNMTSGIDWMDNLNLLRLGLLYYNKNLNRFAIRHCPLKYAPGTHFSYKSLETQLLGICLEAATGQRSADYLQEKLWNPLHMQDYGLFTKDSKRSGNNRMYGGIAISPRDMLRYGQLFRQGGQWQGKQIVPKEWTEQLANRSIEQDKWWGYTNCWWINGYLDGNFLDGTDYFAGGFKEQYVYVNPKYNMIMIRTGNRRESGPDWPVVFGRLAELMNEGGNDLTDPKKNFASQFEGVYETPRGERLEVRFTGKKDDKEKSWSVYKDVNQTLKTKLWHRVYQVDGRSLAYRSYGRQIRLMFEEVNGEVVGLYLGDLFSLDTRYFDKTGGVSQLK